MNSIVVRGVSKVYRRSRPDFRPWQSLVSRFRRSEEPAKRPREIWALRDVSFSVEPGTILGIIGPNGAGKTTLLKVLARITPPSEGRITGLGSVAPLLELGSGLQGELTARENVVLYAAWHGMSRTEAAERLDEIISFAELQDFVDTPLKHFSSGMYVRLAFSIAINMKPDILLADEVLAVGDLAFQERCLERVEEAGAAGMTVLFVSHDMAAIQRLCHRVIWLNAGQVMEDGDPETVVNHYEESAWTLIGGTAKQGKKGKHVSEHGEILKLRLLSADGREIGVVQRSEEVRISLTYSLLTPGSLARCGFVVYTRGLVAFRSIQPEDTLVDQPGIFQASMRIPAKLLADSVYSVKAGVFVFVDGKESPISLDDALTFRVYTSDDASVQALLARGAYKKSSSMTGVLMPELDWTVTRERRIITESTPVEVGKP